ncbi:aggrecan core protein-like protein, partial [Dinothrombium tinctorium]
SRRAIENSLSKIVDRLDSRCSTRVAGLYSTRCYREISREVKSLVESKINENQDGRLIISRDDVNYICCQKQLLYKCFVRETKNVCPSRIILRVLDVLFKETLKLDCPGIAEIEDEDKYYERGVDKDDDDDSNVIRECESGWREYKGKCMWVNENPASAKEAFDSCRFMKAQLVTIHSADENTFFSSITKRGKVYWLGGVQSAYKLHSMVWIDGTPFNYTNWLPIDPNLVLPNCVWLASHGGPGGKWGDEPCVNKFPYVCEKFIGRKTEPFIQEFPENNIIEVLLSKVKALETGISTKCGCIKQSAVDYCTDFDIRL